MSFKVFQSWPKLLAKTPPSTASTARGGWFWMPRNGMNVNPAHHTAADSMLIRAAMPSVSPKLSWNVISTKLRASSRPPPAYPIAQPRLDTRSRSSSVLMIGSRASLKTAAAPKQRFATRKAIAPAASCRR